jgi:hypothetical protein
MPTFVHGKNTFISVNAVDLSDRTKQTEFNDAYDKHDTTTYGPTRERKIWQLGLGDGTITISGTYSTGSTSPRKVLKPLMKARTEVPFVFRPEGTGSGKQQSTVNVLVTSYKDTAPVADMIAWQAELQMTGDLDEADQA